MKGFVNGYYTLSVWITRFAYVNLLWVVFTVLGLGVLGFMPATTAMFAVVRKWVVHKEGDTPIFKLFWKHYRQDFMKANLLGYILAAIGYILFIEFQILRAQENIIYYIASFGVVALFLIYFIVLLYVFPIFSHFNLTIFQYIKWPFIIGIIHPILTIVLIVAILGIFYITFQVVPAIIFFFGGSVIAFILTWASSQTFSKFEEIKA